MTMLSKLGVIVAVARVFGSASTVLAAGNGRATHRNQRTERVAPPVAFEGHDAEVPPLPNWGFGCDPDFGPNDYNPCNAASR
jgi:hypothetical protein